MEQWVQIEDFPGYEVSNLGKVRNEHTGYELGLYDNGRGFKQVVMQRDKRNNARAVHKLVANAFLDPAPEGCVPMHVDRDRDNNTVDNLEWKPLWFVVKHTAQSRQTEPTDHRQILQVKTGVVFENALECARAIGGLENLVILTAQSKFGATYKGSAYQFL